MQDEFKTELGWVIFQQSNQTPIVNQNEPVQNFEEAPSLLEALVYEEEIECLLIIKKNQLKLRAYYDSYERTQLKV